MFADFLWFMGAKQQYDRQKELGLAGLMGILSVLFMVWKWDSIFYPILDRLGLVNMAQRIGLIGEMPILTVLNVVATIFVFCLFLGLISLALVMIGMLLGGTKLGQVILGTAGLVLFLPFIVLFTLKNKVTRLLSPNGNGSLEDTYKRDKELKPLLRKYKNEPDAIKMFKLFEKQITRTDDSGGVSKLSNEKLKSILNQSVSSIKEDRDWQFGYNKWDNKWYVLFNNPLPEYASPCADKKFAQKKKDFFNYPIQDVKGYYVDVGDRESEGFFVPSIEIDFVWKNGNIELVVIEHAYNINVVNTKLMQLFNIRGQAVNEFFSTLSNRNDVYKAIHHAHMVSYLIPLAFRGNVPFTAEKRYNKAVMAMPNVRTHYKLFAEDIKDQIKYYAKFEHQWAIDWILETNKRWLFSEEKI